MGKIPVMLKKKRRKVRIVLRNVSFDVTKRIFLRKIHSRKRESERLRGLARPSFLEECDSFLKKLKKIREINLPRGKK